MVAGKKIMAQIATRLEFLSSKHDEAKHQVIGTYSPEILGLFWAKYSEKELSSEEILMIFNEITQNGLQRTVGEVTITTHNGHKVTVQDFKILGISFEGISYYWYCDKTNRHFVVYYARPEGSLKIEVMDGLNNCLSTIDCH